MARSARSARRSCRRISFTSRGASLSSASFRTRSTTRARRTSTVAMSEPDARISNAGVIIAVIIACAGEMPLTSAADRLVDDAQRRAAELGGEIAGEFRREGRRRGGDAARRADAPPRRVLGAGIDAAAGIDGHLHAVAGSQ